MKHLTFDKQELSSYPVALLVKESAFQERELLAQYVYPLQQRGVEPKEILALSLAYNEQDKAPVSFIKDQLQKVAIVLEQYGVKYVICADAAYFKVIAKVKKAEPHYGYLLPSIFPGVQASLTINYRQLFYNPSLKSRLLMGLDACTNDIQGTAGLFSVDLLTQFSFPSSLAEIKQSLNELYQAPALTCDIETLGLHLNQGAIQSIAFAQSETQGAVFPVLAQYSGEEINPILVKFFENYKGKLIYHNSTFDTKMLINQLYLQQPGDFTNKLLKGLHVLHNNIEDTKILAYLATNSTSGNKLGLKDLAFEFSGNYAIEEIKDISKVPLDQLLRYNAIDSIATFYVYNKYRQQVREEQEDVYTNIFLPALKVLTQTEIVGMPFNINTVREVQKELETIASDHRNFVNNHPAVLALEKELKLEAVLDANSRLKVKRKTVDDFSDLKFNINSHKQLQKLLYDSLQLPVLEFTDKGQASTSGRTIDSLIAWLKNKYQI